jgi:hypothetical protein
MAGYTAAYDSCLSRPVVVVLVLLLRSKIPPSDVPTDPHPGCIALQQALPIDLRYTEYIYSEIPTFILWLSMVSHWQQHVLHVLKLMVPPLANARSVEILGFVLWRSLVSH